MPVRLATTFVPSRQPAMPEPVPAAPRGGPSFAEQLHLVDAPAHAQPSDAAAATSDATDGIGFDARSKPAPTGAALEPTRSAGKRRTPLAPSQPRAGKPPDALSPRDRKAPGAVDPADACRSDRYAARSSADGTARATAAGHSRSDRNERRIAEADADRAPDADAGGADARIVAAATGYPQPLALPATLSADPAPSAPRAEHLPPGASERELSRRSVRVGDATSARGASARSASALGSQGVPSEITDRGSGGIGRPEPHIAADPTSRGLAPRPHEADAPTHAARDAGASSIAPEAARDSIDRPPAANDEAGAEIAAAQALAGPASQVTSRPAFAPTAAIRAISTSAVSGAGATQPVGPAARKDEPRGTIAGNASAAAVRIKTGAPGDDEPLRPVVPTAAQGAPAQPEAIDGTGVATGIIDHAAGSHAEMQHTQPQAVASAVAPPPHTLEAAAAAIGVSDDSTAGSRLHAAHIAAAVGSAEFAPAIGYTLAVFARDGVQHARLELHPAEMGPISVQIAVDGAAARIEFHAAVADTRAALEQALPTLAGALRESGLTLAGGGVFQQFSGYPGREDARPSAPQARQPATPDDPDAAVRAPTVRRGLVDLVA